MYYTTSRAEVQEKTSYLQEFSFISVEKTLKICYNGYVSSIGTESSYSNEIEQFIYEICYRPMWEAAYTYVYRPPYSLNLTYSKIQNPDNAILEDMVLEFPSNIRINGDTLLFDAIVSCTINLTEDSYRGFASHEMSQWLRISCRAVVTDKLDSIDIVGIQNYRSGVKKKKDGHSVSKNIVPILYKKDLESEAEDFLSQYFPEVLEKPTKVPIENIAEKMQLTVVHGSCITDDFSIFGEICFSKGRIDVYNIFKCSKCPVEVERGTILIDAYRFCSLHLLHYRFNRMHLYSHISGQNKRTSRGQLLQPIPQKP